MLHPSRTMLNSLLVAAILLPSLVIPTNAHAQGGGAASCAISATFAAIGKIEGEGKRAAAMKAIAAARKAGLATFVPVNDFPAIPAEAGAPPDSSSQNTGSFWADLWTNYKEACLDKLATDIAKIIIQQMRNMVLNWINTGNIGGSPTFVQSFEYDAKQSAENAARIFASKITGLDFCNYFPRTGPVDLAFRADFRLGIECTLDKSPVQYVADITTPYKKTLRDEIGYAKPEQDPLNVELAIREGLSNAVSSAVKARETQVASGRGFIGVERCKTYKTTREGRWLYKSSGEVVPADVPKNSNEHEFQPPERICTEKETITPGHVAADLATEPLKSAFREGELIDEFGEAISAIVNALVSKVINEGITGKFGN